MSDVLFKCPACTKNVCVPAAAIGLTMPCPDCGNILVTPEPKLFFRCGECSCELSAPGYLAGEFFQCPDCEGGFQIPSGEPAPEVTEDETQDDIEPPPADRNRTGPSGAVMAGIAGGLISALLVFALVKSFRPSDQVAVQVPQAPELQARATPTTHLVQPQPASAKPQPRQIQPVAAPEPATVTQPAVATVPAAGPAVRQQEPDKEYLMKQARSVFAEKNNPAFAEDEDLKLIAGVIARFNLSYPTADECEVYAFKCARLLKKPQSGTLREAILGSKYIFENEIEMTEKGFHRYGRTWLDDKQYAEVQNRLAQREKEIREAALEARRLAENQDAELRKTLAGAAQTQGSDVQQQERRSVSVTYLPDITYWPGGYPGYVYAYPPYHAAAGTERPWLYYRPGLQPEPRHTGDRRNHAPRSAGENRGAERMISISL